MLDVVRSNKFVAEKVGAPTEDVDVPVVGGHSGTTIVPLFSQKVPSDSLGSAEEVAALSVRVQNAGPEGVMKIYPVGDITPYEQDLLDAAIPDIQANIKKGDITPYEQDLLDA